MKRVIKRTIVIVLCISFAIASTALATGATKTIKVLLNGYSVMVKNSKLTDNTIYYNGVVYGPVNVITAGLGGQVKIDNNTKRVSININTDVVDKLISENQELKAKYADYDLIKQNNNALKAENDKLKSQLESNKIPDVLDKFPLTMTIKDVTVKINKVVQDNESLKIFVTYINNSNKPISPAEALTKIVAGSSQFEYDLGFSIDMYQKYNVNSFGEIEPKVNYDSILFFKPVPNVNNINIILRANFEEYRFNNVKVDIQ